MKRVVSILLLIFLFFSITPKTKASNEAIINARMGVVRIFTQVSRYSSATGTAFVVSHVGDKTYLVTNRHCVEDNPNEVYIVTSDIHGKLIKADVTFISNDSYLDLAILSTERLDGYMELPLASTETVIVSAEVYALGFPGAVDDVVDGGGNLPSTIADMTITRGIISNASVGVYGYNFLQTDATITEGNSGGPLLNTAGAVVGVNTYRTVGMEGYNYAIFIDYIIDYFQQTGLPYLPYTPDSPAPPTPPAPPTTDPTYSPTPTEPSPATPVSPSPDPSTAPPSPTATQPAPSPSAPSSLEDDDDQSLLIWTLILVLGIGGIIILVSSIAAARKKEATRSPMPLPPIMPPPPPRPPVSQPAPQPPPVPQPPAPQPPASHPAQRAPQITPLPIQTPAPFSAAANEKPLAPHLTDSSGPPIASPKASAASVSSLSIVPLASPSSDAQSHLYCTRGFFVGKYFPIKGTVYIGRDPQHCNILFPGPATDISRIHCSIQQTQSGLTLTDLKSLCGTFLSGGRKLEAYESIELISGDCFHLANTDNEFMVY